MDSKIIFFLVGIIYVVNGHTFLSSIVINGVAQPADDCIRPQYPGSPGIYRNSPINDVAVFPNGILSNNMTCGFLPYANNQANKKCTIPAGATVALQWYHNTPNVGDDYIEGTHKGPVLAYMTKQTTGTDTPTSGWFKIYHDGFSNGIWAATDKLKSNSGKFSFTIPNDIAPGNYLLRGELIALHDGDKPSGAQPYVGCVEVVITGTGTANPVGVNIPGVYSKTDPGIAFNLYSGFSSYPIPGPAVYVPGTSGTVATTNSITSGVAGASTGRLATTGVAGATTGRLATTGATRATTQSASVTSGLVSNSGNTGCSVTDCVTVCGEGKVKTCQCVNGEPVIECETSNSVYLIASFALILIGILF